MLIKKVKHGERSPVYYGYVNRNYERDYVNTAIIPFNIILRVLYLIYTTLRYAGIGVVLEAREAYYQGRKDERSHIRNTPLIMVEPKALSRDDIH